MELTTRRSTYRVRIIPVRASTYKPPTPTATTLSMADGVFSALRTVQATKLRSPGRFFCVRTWKPSCRCTYIIQTSPVTCCPRLRKQEGQSIDEMPETEILRHRSLTSISELRLYQTAAGKAVIYGINSHVAKGFGPHAKPRTLTYVHGCLVLRPSCQGSLAKTLTAFGKTFVC